MIVLALLLGVSVGYFGSVAGGVGKATQVTTTSIVTSTETSTITSTINQFPCSQKPLQEKSGYNSASTSLNGTGLAEIDYPVFALAPGSQGSFCVSYTNDSNSSLSNLSYLAFDWTNASQTSNGISVVESPTDASVPPHGNATVIYTVKASNSSTGAYGLSVNHDCGSYQLIVSDDASNSNFSEFPGLLGNLTSPAGPNDCLLWQPPGTLSGFGGLNMNMVYLQYKTLFAIPFYETSRSIQSVVESPTEQNITIKLGIESYAIPVTVGEPSPGTLNDWYYMAQWSGNPQLSPTPGDACDWNVGNSTMVGRDTDLFPLLQGVTVNAPTLHLQPYSNGTFTFSIEISNLTQGYGGGYGTPTYVSGGYFATLLSALVTWDGGVRGTSGYATLDLSTFFPVGQIGEPASGSCTVPKGFWTNVPWYLGGISF